MTVNRARDMHLNCEGEGEGISVKCYTFTMRTCFGSPWEDKGISVRDEGILPDIPLLTINKKSTIPSPVL